LGLMPENRGTRESVSAMSAIEAAILLVNVP
jgi:hypothetical protein